MTNKQFAVGLRELANFYESHEDFPQSELTWIWAGNKEEFRNLALQLGRFKKNYTDNYFTMERDFSGVKLRVTTPRDVVCTKHVVRTEYITERVAKTVEYEDKLVAKEVIEWKCGESLIADPLDKVEILEPLMITTGAVANK